MFSMSGVAVISVSCSRIRKEISSSSVSPMLAPADVEEVVRLGTLDDCSEDLDDSLTAARA